MVAVSLSTRTGTARSAIQAGEKRTGRCQRPMSHVFLDLDGTVSDNGPGIIACITHALTEIGSAVPNPDALARWIGPPLLDSFRQHLGDEEGASRALALYRERYVETGLYENKVYDGVPRMLDELGRSGASLALATSKPRVYAERILQHFGLSGRFTHIFGAEFDGTRSDKTSLIAHALLETGKSADQCVMIGDREHDIIGARANGVASIGVLWGFGARTELECAGVNCIAAVPMDVPGLVRRFAEVGFERGSRNG